MNKQENNRDREPLKNEPIGEADNQPAEPKNPKKSFPFFTVAIISVIIIGGALWLGGKSDKDNQTSEAGNKANPVSDNGKDNPSGQMAETKIFDIISKSFEFSMKEIRVKKGDKVRINLKNDQGFHNWVIDEFNARTKQLNAGQSDTVEFIADRTGTFEYYCSVATHRQMGMMGKLIVE